METPIINNYPELIEMDINSGANYPERDSSGVRSFSMGERAILTYWEKPIKEQLKIIFDANSNLIKTETRAKLYYEGVKKHHEQYLAEKRELEDKILQREKEIQKKEKNRDFYIRLKSFGNSSVGFQENGKRRDAKKQSLWSNVLLVVVIESIVSAATWMIQRETLELESIFTRIGFLLAIGVASVYQLRLYYNTGKKLIKVFHDITLFLSFICIIDGLLVGYFFGDISATTTSGFNLEQVYLEEQISESRGIESFLVSFPGAIELITTVLLLLISKMQAVEQVKHTKQESNSIDKKITFENIGIEDLKKENKEDKVRLSRIKELDAVYQKESQEMLVKFEKEKNAFKESSSMGKYELDKIVEAIVYVLSVFRSDRIEADALKNSVAVSSLPPYELATESDVRTIQSINF